MNDETIRQSRRQHFDVYHYMTAKSWHCELPNLPHIFINRWQEGVEVSVCDGAHSLRYLTAEGELTERDSEPHRFPNIYDATQAIAKWWRAQP